MTHSYPLELTSEDRIPKSVKFHTSNPQPSYREFLAYLLRLFHK